MAVEYFSSPLSHFDSTDLLDALSTGIVVLDSHLCIIYANVGAQDLLGLSLNLARGRPIGELFAGSQQLVTTLRRSLEHAESCAEREITLRPIGTPAPRDPHVVDVTVTPLEGQITGTHLLVEIYDAKQRQRLARENELLTRLDGSRLMIRHLAHETKNPLGGLRGAAQLLDRELSQASLKEYTAVVIQEADRLTALVDSMLGPNRPPQKSQVNVHELCEHVFHLLRAEAPPQVSIDRDYDPSLPPGILDRHQVIQALLNVARNAMQAVSLNPEGRGRVLLRTRALSNATIGNVRHRLLASVQVEDNGPGVLPELASTLFYPLVTGRPNGTGLGLAVAQDLVTRHGGIVEYESEPGRTVFQLLLPLEGNE